MTLPLVFYPRTIVHGAVLEGEDTLSLLLVVLKITFVVASILPPHLSSAFSLAIDPVANVGGFARPSELATFSSCFKTVTDIFYPVAIVLRSILPSHNTFSMSFVILELAYVSASVLVLHCALPILLAFEPFANVFSITCVYPFESSLPMDFVILEVTNEGIAFLISQHAVSFSLVVYPCTYV